MHFEYLNHDTARIVRYQPLVILTGDVDSNAFCADAATRKTWSKAEFDVRQDMIRQAQDDVPASGYNIVLAKCYEATRLTQPITMLEVLSPPDLYRVNWRTMERMGNIYAHYNQTVRDNPSIRYNRRCHSNDQMAMHAMQTMAIYHTARKEGEEGAMNFAMQTLDQILQLAPETAGDLYPAMKIFTETKAQLGHHRDWLKLNYNSAISHEQQFALVIL